MQEHRACQGHLGLVVLAEELVPLRLPLGAVEHLKGEERATFRQLRPGGDDVYLHLVGHKHRRGLGLRHLLEALVPVAAQKRNHRQPVKGREKFWVERARMAEGRLRRLNLVRRELNLAEGVVGIGLVGAQLQATLERARREVEPVLHSERVAEVVVGDAALHDVDGVGIGGDRSLPVPLFKGQLAELKSHPPLVWRGMEQGFEQRPLTAGVAFADGEVKLAELGLRRREVLLLREHHPPLERSEPFSPGKVEAEIRRGERERRVQLERLPEVQHRFGLTVVVDERPRMIERCECSRNGGGDGDEVEGPRGQGDGRAR